MYDGTEQVQDKWYAKQNREPHAAVAQRVKVILDNQLDRRTSVRRSQQLYGVDLRAYGITPDATIDRRYTINHLKNSVDTLAAKISRVKTLPYAITAGGNYMQQQRSKKLSRFIEGAFEDTKFWTKQLNVDLATLVDGTGCMKVTSEYDQLKLEVVPMLDLFVDDAEGRYGSPRNLIQRHLVDRGQVMAMYGDANSDGDLYGSLASRRAAIETAPIPTDTEMSDFVINSGADLIYLYEAWHLPSSPYAKDGKYVVCLDNGTMLTAEWRRARFPFAFQRRNVSLVGFWGSSAVWEFGPAQEEHNVLSRKLQQAHNIMGGSHIIMQAGTLGKTVSLDNGIGTIIEYQPGGSPPQTFNPDPVNPQTYAYRNSIPQEINQGLGLSNMSAHSELPAGLRAASGKALQVYEDFESERLHVFHKLHEQFAIDVSELIMEECESLLASDIDVSVARPTKSELQSVAWSEVRMDQREYRLRVYPISNLSRQPSAKFEQILSLGNIGLVDKPILRRLLDLPDVDAEEDLASAPMDAVDMQLYEMVESRKYASPSEYIDPAMAMERAKLFYAKCLVDKVPERKLALVAEYINECAAAIAGIQAEQQAAAQPGGVPAGEQTGGMTQEAAQMAGEGAAPPNPASMGVPQ
jgi:hypothetical protein